MNGSGGLWFKRSLGAITADGSGAREASADDSSAAGLACLSVIGETLDGWVRSVGVGEWVRSATGLGGVGNGLKVFVSGFTQIGELGEVEFGGDQLLLK